MAKVTKKPTALKKAIRSVGRPKKSAAPTKTVKKVVKAAEKTVKKAIKAAPKKATAKKTAPKAIVKKTVAKKVTEKKVIAKKVIAKKVTAKKVVAKKATVAAKSISFIAQIQSLVLKAQKESGKQVAALQKQALKVNAKLAKAQKAQNAAQEALAAPATAKKLAKLQVTLKEATKEVEQLTAETQTIAATQQQATEEQAILNSLQFTAPEKIKTITAPTTQAASKSSRGRPKKSADVSIEKETSPQAVAAPQEMLEEAAV